LVKIEADYDKKLKESQTQTDVVVRWDVGLTQKRVAWFVLPKLESGEVRLAAGDELRLEYRGEMREEWEGFGRVVKMPNSKCDQGLTCHISRDQQTSLTKSLLNFVGLTMSRLIVRTTLLRTSFGNRLVSTGCNLL
jgi:hypothetical protein